MGALGAVVVDADAIARDIVRPGQPALEEIRGAFGDHVIAPDGTLDRSALAAIVFDDSDALTILNSITHPRIAERSAQMIAEAPGGSVIVYDMPLLVEQGPEALAGWDAVVVVDAPDEVRLDRLVARGLDREDAQRRMAVQVPRDARLAAADHVIDNSGDLPMLERAVDALWTSLTSTGT